VVDGWWCSVKQTCGDPQRRAWLLLRQGRLRNNLVTDSPLAHSRLLQQHLLALLLLLLRLALLLALLLAHAL
jgi:hypothetical protein